MLYLSVYCYLFYKSGLVDNNEGRKGDSFRSDNLGDSFQDTMAVKIFTASLQVHSIINIFSVSI